MATSLIISCVNRFQTMSIVGLFSFERALVQHFFKSFIPIKWAVAGLRRKQSEKRKKHRNKKKTNGEEKEEENLRKKKNLLGVEHFGQNKTGKKKWKWIPFRHVFKTT